MGLLRYAKLVGTWLRKNVGGQAIVDTFSWFLAVLVAGFLRFEFALDRVDVGNFILFGLVAAVPHWGVGKISGLYGSRFPAGSFDEALNLVLVTFLATIPAALVSFVWGATSGVPRSTIFIAAPIFLILSGLVRSIRRLRRRYVTASKRQKKAIVYGAGRMAELLIQQLLADSSSRYSPVALIDDDPSKANRWISGVKTKGTLEDLPHILKSVSSDVLIVAIPRAKADLLQRVRNLASSFGLEVLILPSFSEILDKNQNKLELKQLGIEELVGRQAVSINSDEIQHYLEGQTVLVTGAGGSIGVELCRQVSRYMPRRLIFLDRDETGLQLAQLAVNGSGLLDNFDIVLADIREEGVIEDVFQSLRPSVVFHAAALKHLPALEKFPQEAWKTNVLGTANVLAAASRSGVSHFVNISTDKAADPTSVLGKSKKLAEELTSWYSSHSAGQYHSVRFGNVLGSRGSLIPTLQYLIESDRPITITDPEATRFFMTIPEACQLVLQAGSEKLRNSVLILDMGSPVKIIDIANRMIEMSGKEVKVVYTGLRPGEKLHEDLFSGYEFLEKSSHKLIWRVKSPALDPRDMGERKEDFVVPLSP